MTERLRLGSADLTAGDRFYFRVDSLTPHDKPIRLGGQITDIRRGGFYGKTMLFDDDIVLKTTQPDSLHQLGRRFNWNLGPFPPQALESAAQLDHLSAKIIHLILPAVTANYIISPDSYGYTHLGPLGFAQVLERVHGHGARFHVSGENERLQNARRGLWELGVSLGLEHAAQIHPDNPFGKPNIWVADKDDRIIWLDMLPAIKHTGWVWPFYWPPSHIFYFPFHEEVRQRFGERQPTFNHLHTQNLRAFLKKHQGEISSTVMDEISYYLVPYDLILPEYQREMEKGTKDLLIADALKRDLITRQEAHHLQESHLAYSAFLTKTIIEPVIGIVRESLEENMLYRAYFEGEFQQDIVRFIQDPAFRRVRIIENTILNGLREAYLLGLVSEEEWQDAWQVLENPPISREEAKKLLPTYLFLETGYLASSTIFNVLEVGLYASAFFAENPISRAAAGFLVGWVLPPLLRVALTASTAAVTRQDLRYATIFSAVPKMAWATALSADLGHRFGNRSELVWHYTKRWLIASLSKILRKWGGWNSNVEENLWNLLRVEKW